MTSSKITGLHHFLSRITARSVLSTKEKDAILTLPAQTVTLKAKRDFVQEKEETSYCCLVDSGLVGRFGQLENGTRQITAFHIPGDMADLHAAVRPIGTGGLQALTNATVMRIPRDAIRTLMARYPAVAEAFWRDCMLDAAVLTQWVMNVGRRDAPTRLAHMFCEMALRYGHDRQARREYAFPVTQEQLGEAVALTGVHINRSLKSLRDSGLVTVKKGVVHIHSWSKLVRVGEFDPTYLMANTEPDRPTRLLAA